MSVGTCISWLAVLLLVFTTYCQAKPRNSRQHEYCYGELEHPYSLMGTRTSYEFVRAEKIERLSPESKCKPVQIWGMMRHGSRYPKEQSIEKYMNMSDLRDKIVENHKNGRGELCPTDLENLRKWYLDMDDVSAGNLSTYGKWEMYHIASRFKAAFPELLDLDPQYVTQGDFIFRATGTERTDDSADMFQYALFNRTDVVERVEPPENDTLLLATKNCPAYAESIIEDEVFSEFEKFNYGPEVRGVRSRIGKRLGFNKLISRRKLKLLWDVCRYEKSWHDPKRLSAWCAVFSAEDMRIMEYGEDTSCYYYSGSGREINAKIGCPPLREMMRHFRNLESEKTRSNEPKGVFYFSRTVTLQTVLAAFGIGKQSTPILATNYEENKDRIYRTSLIGPFAGNVVSVFYDCEDPISPHKVQIYVSEKLWHLDGCDNGVCDWEVLKQKYGDAADTCDLKFCNESYKDLKF